MSETTASAELIADRGAAAASGEDFFRSRPFLEAEGVTHTLRIALGRRATDPATAGSDSGPRRAELLAPLIVREIPGTDARDATSPYGYPGLTPTPPERGRGSSRIAQPTFATPLGSGGDGGALDPGAIDFAGTGLVSVFIRHALGEPPLAGSRERNVVQIADPALAPKSRPSDRRQIRRNLEAGYELELTSAAETTPAQRGAFLDLYEQTMRRAAAAEHYFFGATYFERVLEAPRTWLAIARAPAGEPAAASLAAASDGFLHYYLSGSADAHLRDSPMKNVVARLAELAAELGLPLNLGGGIARGDALEEFKRGFANRELTWRTSELICDPERYAELSAGKDTGDFFPAYRS